MGTTVSGKVINFPEIFLHVHELEGTYSEDMCTTYSGIVADYSKLLWLTPIFMCAKQGLGLSQVHLGKFIPNLEGVRWKLPLVMSSLKKKLSQLPAVDMHKVPGSFCYYSKHAPKVIQPSFDAQSLCQRFYIGKHVEFEWNLGWRMLHVNCMHPLSKFWELFYKVPLCIFKIPLQIILSSSYKNKLIYSSPQFVMLAGVQSDGNTILVLCIEAPNFIFWESPRTDGNSSIICLYEIEVPFTNNNINKKKSQLLSLQLLNIPEKKNVFSLTDRPCGNDAPTVLHFFVGLFYYWLSKRLIITHFLHGRVPSFVHFILAFQNDRIKCVDRLYQSVWTCTCRFLHFISHLPGNLGTGILSASSLTWLALPIDYPTYHKMNRQGGGYLHPTPINIGGPPTLTYHIIISSQIQTHTSPGPTSSGPPFGLAYNDPSTTAPNEPNSPNPSDQSKRKPRRSSNEVRRANLLVAQHKDQKSKEKAALAWKKEATKESKEMMVKEEHTKKAQLPNFTPFGKLFDAVERKTVSVGTESLPLMCIEYSLVSLRETLMILKF
ncbi:hypothetical protein VP01_71g5 [Puccinia sorghi]|uniref:Uncharacterized protein n=1 Tax=Puccinia sorghi TaxID=27349 RepID=A0A0L6UE49_9BASI|nr:hypothetical protein VP01_71g5 [Puccinia sorghi]